MKKEKREKISLATQGKLTPSTTLLCPGIYKEMEATTKIRKIDCNYLLKKASYCTNWSSDPTHLDKRLAQ